MTIHRWSGLALLGWVGVVPLACGDDDGGEDGNAPPPVPVGGKAGSSGGGRIGATGGRDSEAGAGNDAGAGGTVSTGGSGTGGVPLPIGGSPLSGAHIPDVPPEQTGEVFTGDPVTGFEVTHSHYYAAGPASTDHYWLGIVENQGDETKCALAVSVTIEGPGSAPVKFAGPVVAPMYRFEGETARLYCLSPGARGVAVAQPVELAPEFAPEDLTAISYGVAGEDAGDVVPADWFQLQDVEILSQGLKSRVVGTLEKTTAAAVSGVAVVVFPKNADGAPLFHYRLRDTRASAPSGSIWRFQTPFFDGNFGDALVFYEHNDPGAP